jgi:hypothetical protein
MHCMILSISEMKGSRMNTCDSFIHTDFAPIASCSNDAGRNRSRSHR